MAKLLVRKNLPVITTLALAVLLVAIGLYVKTRPTPNKQEGYHPKAEPSQATPPSNQTPSSPNSQPAEPVNVPKTEQTTDLIVSSPGPGSKLAAGMLVQGKARVFEGRVAFRVKSSQRGVLIQGFTNVSGDATLLSPFSFEIQFEDKLPDAGDSGALEVFSYSPRDGSEINKVIIPVNF